MAQPGDHEAGRGPGYTRAAGFGPQGPNPRMQIPATPPQFQREAPPRQDPQPAPQHTPRPAQAAFTPGYHQEPPRAYHYVQPQYQPPQQYAPQPQHAPPPRPGKRRVFLWAFLAVQALFIVWIIAGLASHPAGPTAAQQAAQQCANGGWYPLFKSQADCQVHFAHGLNEASTVGKGIGAALIIVFWMVTDFFLGLGYGIYRLASRR